MPDIDISELEPPPETEECPRCEARVNADDMREVFEAYDTAMRRYRSGSVCEDCRNNHYVWCEPLEEYHRNTDIVTADDSGENAPLRYAQSHWHWSDATELYYAEVESMPQEDADSDDYDGEGHIFSYGTNVIEVQGWPSNTKRTDLCFGVELEMEPQPRHTREAICTALGNRKGDGRYILCHDGSLDNGVEAITLPYSLEYHQTSDLWRKITGAASGLARSGQGTNNCGLHIHINRKPLSALTVGKMLVFVNAPECTDLVTTVAQRDGRQWAHRYPKKFTDGFRQHSDHYDALGLTSKGTLELRIFRGNLRRERILKALEFAHALVRYCEQSSMMALTEPRRFLQFVRANKKTYPNLLAFIVERKGLTGADTTEESEA